MKIPNKRELQQIASNHPSDISTKDFINIYKKYNAKPYFFKLLILHFHQIILYDLEKIILIMTINDQIIDENLQYNINREAAKISALSLGKINKYEYLTG